MVRQVGVEVVFNAREAAANLNAFTRQFQSSLDAQVAAINEANLALKSMSGLRGAGTQIGNNSLGGTSPYGVVEDIDRAREAVTKYGNAIKTTREYYVTTADGTKILTSAVVDYRGNLETLIQAEARYGNLLDERRIAADRATDSTRNLAKANEQSQLALNDANLRVQELRANPALQPRIPGGTKENPNPGGGRFAPINVNDPAYIAASAELSKAVQEQAQIEAKATNDLRAYRERVVNLENDIGLAYNERLAAAKQEVILAKTGAPALPFGLNTIREESPQLFSKFQKLGLGNGFDPIRQPAQFQTAVAQQGAYENFTVNRNLLTGVTQVSAAWKDQKQVLQQVRAEYLEDGTVISKFGGQMNGLGTILSQLYRNFTKVIEFAVATVAVFAAFNKVSEAISTINAIDKGLRQLSVTANLSSEDTTTMFGKIADIAINTATPIEELVKATDDIALATRRAGQSSQEWRSDILSLTESVGILTNLAGIDTVQATDLLVASMKQLNLQANQLPGLLNKITAVAGGQSGAIADIIKGLGTMAEAGTQAGLTLDQMIATVQVLSQVTSKTPAEVATSFKTLVGALGNPLAIKELAKLKIPRLDPDGNLRNILDIYTDINKQIANGKILASQIPEVTRALAGGPRRQADAAALLGGIGAISQTTQKGAQATNEAFIAQAKILDTTQKKVVQLQAQFDKFAFEKFGAAIKGAANNLLQFATTLLGIFNNIPTGGILALLQIPALAVGTRAVVSVFGIIKNSITGFFTGLGQLKTLLGIYTKETFGAAEATTALAAAQTKAAATGNTMSYSINGAIKAETATEATTGLRGFANKYSKGLKGLGLAGAAGAGLDLGFQAATGNINPVEILGTGLQSIGLEAILNPVIPLPLKAAGVIAGIAGTLINLTQSSGEAEAAQKKNTEALLDMVSAYGNATTTLSDFLATQDELNQKLAQTEKQLKANPHNNQTQELKNQLSSYSKEYGQNVLDVAEAYNAVAAARNKLRDSIKDDSKLTKELNFALSGVANAEQLKKITADLATKLLQAQDPNFKGVGELQLPTGSLTDTHPLEHGTTIAQIPGLDVRGKVVDVDEDLKKLTDIRSIFKDSPDGKSVDFRIKIHANIETVQLLQGLLDNLKGHIPTEDFDKMQLAIDGLKADNQLSQIERVTDAVQKYQSYLTAASDTGLITPDQFNRVSQLVNLLQLAGTLEDNLKNSPEGLPAPVVDPFEHGTAGGKLADRSATLFDPKHAIDDIKQKIDEAISNPGKALDTNFFTEIAKDILEAGGNVKDFGDKFKVLGLAATIAHKLGYEIDKVTGSIKALSTEANTAAENINKDLESSKSSILSGVANKTASLFDQKLGGQFDTGKKGSPTEADFSVQNTQQNEIGAGANKVIALLEAESIAFTELADKQGAGANAADFFNQAVGQLFTGLSKLPGMQDAAGLSAGQLVTKIYALAEAAGVSGKGMDALTGHVVKLIENMAKLDKIKAKFHIDINADPSQAIKAMQAMKAIYLQSIGKLGAGIANASPEFLASITSQIQTFDDTIALLKKIGGNISTEDSSITSIIGSGKGTAFGNPPGAGAKTKVKPGLDVSTLDLPDEIFNASNKNALIQKAIAMAKELQHKIPGADKDAKNDVVEVLHGMDKLLEVRGVKEDLLARALKELADVEQKRLEFDTKADFIQRIRVGSGSFAALANVPLNSATGVSVGGPNGPITVNLNINGQILTPAQFTALSNKIAAAILRQAGK